MMKNKIILYGGGAVIVFAVIFALLPKSSGSSGGVVIQARSPDEVAASTSLGLAQIQADGAIALAGYDIAAKQLEVQRDTVVGLYARDSQLAGIGADERVATLAIQTQRDVELAAIDNEADVNIVALNNQLAAIRDTNATDSFLAVKQGETATNIASLNANIDIAAINASQEQNRIFGESLSGLKSKDKRKALQTFISGQNTTSSGGPSKTAQVIDSVGGLAKTIGKFF